MLHAGTESSLQVNPTKTQCRHVIFHIFPIDKPYNIQVTASFTTLLEIQP